MWGLRKNLQLLHIFADSSTAYTPCQVLKIRKSSQEIPLTRPFTRDRLVADLCRSRSFVRLLQDRATSSPARLEAPPVEQGFGLIKIPVEYANAGGAHG